MRFLQQTVDRRSHFETLRTRLDVSSQRSLRSISNGTGDDRYCYRNLCQDALSQTCIALGLGRPDQEAAEHAVAAARYARGWLLGKGSSGEGIRAFAVEVSVDAQGGVTPGPLQPLKVESSSLLGNDEFATIASVTVAFAPQSQWSEVARYSEDGYRNPNIIGPEEVYGKLRALKALMRGEEQEAEREARAVLSAKTQRALHVSASMLLSLITRDSQAFARFLNERLASYKKQYQPTPHIPLSLMCLDAMAMCRMAGNRGLELTSEAPALPLRLLRLTQDLWA